MTTFLVLALLFAISARIFYKRHSRKLEKLLLGNSSRGSGGRGSSGHETKPFLRPADSGSSSSNGKSDRKDSDAAPEMFEPFESDSPVSTIMHSDDV